MPDPVQTAQPQQQQESLPQIDRSAVAERLVRQVFAGRKAAIEAGRIDLLASRTLQELGAEQHEPARALASQHARSYLETQELSTISKATEAEHWNNLDQYATLRQLSPNDARAFQTLALAHGKALIAQISSSLEHSKGNIATLDEALRKTKVARQLSPEGLTPQFDALLDTIFSNARSLSSDQVQAHCTAILDDSKKFLDTNARQNANHLPQIISLANDSPELVAPLWRELAGKLQETRTDSGSSFHYKTAEGSTWELQILGRASAQVPESGQFVFRCPEHSDALCTLSRDSLASLLTNKSLDTRLGQAIRDREAETSKGRAEIVRDIRFSPDTTACLIVAPQQLDGTTTNALFGSMLLANAVVTGNNPQQRQDLIISDTPLEAITKSLKEMREAGQPLKDVVIDISQHGSREGLLFERAITAESLLTLAKAFPDTHFHISTLACHGGGLPAALTTALASQEARTNDLASRISLYTQVKPESLNMLSPTGEPGTRPSLLDFNAPVQQMLFIKTLLEYPGEIGKAFDTSDRESKKIIPLDSEALHNGHRLSSREKNTATRLG